MSTKQHVEVAVTFSATHMLNISAICKELGIAVGDIARLSIKYCHLFFTLHDGRELEYATSAYEAELDTKYPSEAATYVDNKLVATNNQYRGEILLHPTQNHMYVLSVSDDNTNWHPVFASPHRYECEMEVRTIQSNTDVQATSIGRVRGAL